MKREQSRAGSRFAECEKSRLKAKILITLALLLTAVTGAWADGTVTVTELKASEMPTSWANNSNPVKATDLPGFTAVSDEEVVNIPAPLTNGAIFMIYAFNGTNIKFVNYYNGEQVYKGEDYYNRDNIAYIAFDEGSIIYYTGTAPAPSGPTVDWNKASKTGTFTMPGGNVELEPEYYPQAALTAKPTAINDVPATTDGAIVNAGTVKNITGTTTAQGTVMYYVSTTALDDAALLALAADAWTADVPTAESFTAAGQAYVYYYVRGNDSDNDDEIFSDGDILATNALTVTIAAAPTYAVTFADDLAEPTEWTASPAANVTKGETVTVTYSGSKKVLGVKAEKKKRPEFVPSATIQNLESFVEVENNKDGTITLHMPTLKPSTYYVTNSNYSNGENTLHFGYELGSGTNMSNIGANVIDKIWTDHTPFSEMDKTIDITSGMPRVAIIIIGHLRSATCPAPGAEHFWGLYRYTNPVKVTYNLGGGSVSGSTADKVEYLFSGDALATTFAAPTREGFTFDGWYTSAEGGTKLTASNATSATTIYAHWNAIAE